MAMVMRRSGIRARIVIVDWKTRQGYRLLRGVMAMMMMLLVLVTMLLQMLRVGYLLLCCMDDVIMAIVVVVVVVVVVSIVGAKVVVLLHVEKISAHFQHIFPHHARPFGSNHTNGAPLARFSSSLSVVIGRRTVVVVVVVGRIEPREVAIAG